MRGFMDGHTQWMSVEDEEEVDHGAAGNKEGQQHNNDGEDQADPSHDGEEAAPNTSPDGEVADPQMMETTWTRGRR